MNGGVRLFGRMPSQWIKILKRIVIISLFVALGGSYTVLPQFPNLALHSQKIARSTERVGARTIRPMIKLKSHVISATHINLTAPVTELVIQPQETLWSIANRLGTTVEVLESLNHLTSTVIYAGARLVVPLDADDNPISSEPTTSDSRIQYTAKVMNSSTMTADATRVSGNAGVSYNREDVNLLAHLVQAEAGTQSLLGQVAVGAVVINRLNNPRFPKTLVAVIEQPGQFESVANGTFWQQPSPRAYLAAKDALQGWDPTGGALFYYNPTLPHSPWMNTLIVTATIGAQVFCR